MNAIIFLLVRIIGLGVETAQQLAHEILFRNLRDRKAVARYAGVTGSPDESGSKRRKRDFPFRQWSRAQNTDPVIVADREDPTRERSCALVQKPHPERSKITQADHSGARAKIDHRALALCQHRRGA
jgi:transposase